MQTFLPFANFAASAQALDNRRLGKQRVETFQILQRLHGKRMITSQTVGTGVLQYRKFDDDTSGLVEVFKTVQLTEDKWESEDIDAGGWDRHPAVKMWRGYACELLRYQEAICNEWVLNRGFKDTCRRKSIALHVDHVGCTCGMLAEDNGSPPWLGDEDFHRSHQSNLVRKLPEVYGPLFPGVPDDLPYIWPEGRW